MRQAGTFNTIGYDTVQFGGDFPVWSRINKVYQGGGMIDVAGMGLKPGDVIHAGTMVKFNGAGKAVEVITSDGVTGIKEVDKITITKGATASGNVGITLNGAAVVNIAVTTEEDTPSEVAAKIAAGTYTGWTAKQEGDSVIFTKSTAEKCLLPQVTFNDTGIEGTMEVVTEGAAASGQLTDVNGLIAYDVCIPDGCILATCAVCYDGRIYADRVYGGGIPTSVEKQLPAVEFVREDYE